MCEAKDLDVTGTFNGYNGATRNVTTRLRVEGCRPAIEASARGLRRRPVVTVKVSRPALGEKLRAVTLTLPSGLKFNQRALRRGLSVTAGARRLPAGDVKARGRRLTIAGLPGAGADSVRITMRTGAVVASAKLRRAVKRRTASLEFTARVVDAAGARSTIYDVIAGR
jgi:hypothetical protein